jgi:hypothetical protein
MSNDRMSLYREAIELEQKRADLQSELEQLASKLTSIHSQILTGEVSSEPRQVSESTGPVKTSTPTRRRARRSKRGELKSAILNALSSAGAQGLRVLDLARDLASKPANIYAWFQNATKRMPQIKKIGEAHYRLEGKAAASTPATAKPAAGKKGKKGKRSQRGGLAAQITEALTAAGKTGMNLRDLADKLGTKYANLSVWFATTGKKNKAIKKIGAGQYRLEA